MTSNNTYLTPTTHYCDLSSYKVDRIYPMRHPLSTVNRPAANSSNQLSILSPPISPSGKIYKHPLNVTSDPVSRVPTPTPCTINNSNVNSNKNLLLVKNSIYSNPAADHCTHINSCNSDALNSRFPHNFPPMKSFDSFVYKPAPGTTENKFRELVEEKRRLDQSPIHPPFADYNTQNFVDSDSASSSSLPMTSCAWDQCRTNKHYMTTENANLHNYKRGIPVHDPYSLAVHSISNTHSHCKSQSVPSTPKHSSRARLSRYEHDDLMTTRSALKSNPTRVMKEFVATTSNTPSRGLRHNDAGLATLGAAVLAIVKQTPTSPLPPIRSIHGTSSTVQLPPISSLSSPHASSIASSATTTPPIQYTTVIPCDHYSNVSTPLQSPRVGHSSLNNNNTPSASSNLRFVNSVQSIPTSLSSTPKKARKQGTFRKRVPPILSRVHDMEPSEVPDYTISAACLPLGKTLKAEWKGTPMDLTKDPNFHKLHPAEINLAATLRLSVDLYLDSKKRLFAEKVHRFKQGLPFRRTDSQKACRIDVNKASRLFVAYEKVGWLDDSNFEQYRNEPLSVTSRH